MRAFICEWMSERVKDNNKRDEHGRTKMQRERERENPPIEAVHREEYSIRISGKR